MADRRPLASHCSPATAAGRHSGLGLSSSRQGLPSWRTGEAQCSQPSHVGYSVPPRRGDDPEGPPIQADWPLRSACAVDDSPFGQVVWRQLDRHFVTGKDAYVILTHFSRDVGGYNVAVLQLHSEHRIGQSLYDPAVHFYVIFLRHAHLCRAQNASYLYCAEPACRWQSARPLSPLPLGPNPAAAPELLLGLILPLVTHLGRAIHPITEVEPL